MSPEIPIYKVLLVGESGKWSFLQLWEQHAHAAYTNPKSGFKTYPVQFLTNCGKIQLDFLGISLRWLLSLKLKGDAMIFIDDATYLNDTQRLKANSYLRCLDIPLIICEGSPSKCRETGFTRKLFGKNILHVKRLGQTGRKIFNAYRPLLWLMRKLENNPQVDWVGVPRHCAPTLRRGSINSRLSEVTLGDTSTRSSSIAFTPATSDDSYSNNQENTDIYDNSDETCQTTTDDSEEFIVFILCVHCIRMIAITSPETGSLVRLIPLSVPCSLVTIICRHCSDTIGLEMPDSLPFNVVKHTRMYDCAETAAGKKVEILLGDNDMTWTTNLPDLAESTDTDCCIYGIRTDDDTISRLHEVEAADLWLEHVPGAFL
ncbi:hypothetical protein BGW36DRAFT_408174 [Talaromyces proteolyticus]|uniref:Uncharacterized protein n=1 Tax=Talaromyces proteolyticus TaxID=1131652 RepID=A0AAD4KSU3_9EURO|nr:uncharacterized protein BGW36DRAFT_408174 [Talaromyces proteolyticus]KAH8696240.1 hypothetical protein BGW36DRAFT_408174 [Talaromyces proteolyticus]